MATANTNLSEYNINDVPDGKNYRVGIIVSEWNSNITGNLTHGAEETLRRHGVKEENIVIKTVPGTYELPLGAQWMIQYGDFDVIIAIGSVIQGETKHFDFVCDSTAHGVREVSLSLNTPVIFCVLTDNNMQQAIDRSGGKHGNKGVESAVAALKMCDLHRHLKSY